MGLVMKIKFTDVIREDTLKNYYVNGKTAGFEFDVRLSYYRGHFLSDIEELSLRLDGEAFAENDILFCLNGKEIPSGELKYQISEFWPIIIPATLRVRKRGGLSGGKHDLDLTLLLRCPYLPLPGAVKPHAYTPIDSSERKIVTLKEESK